MNFDSDTTRGGGFISLPFIKPRPKSPGKKESRLPIIGFVPNKIRNHIVAFAGEFVGTFMFLFFAFSGTQVANAASSGGGGSDGSLSMVPNAGSLLYISLVFGFSLAVNAWVFFRISGGLFNPAVTLALAMVGAITWVRAGLVFIAQILASMASAGVVSALFPSELNVATTLGGGTSTAQGLFIEMFLTAELVFTIYLLAAEKHKGTFLAPVGIGLALFIAELSGVYYTGGSLNPARSFGPCVVLGNFPTYHWIYWLGPFLGTIIAFLFYRFVKNLDYETANPGQDFNEKEADNFEFDEDNATGRGDVQRPPSLGPEEIAALSSRGSDQVPGTGGRVSSPTGRGMTMSPVRHGSRVPSSETAFDAAPAVENGTHGEARQQRV